MLAPADPHTLSRTTVQFTTPAPSYPTHKITKRRRTTVQITTLAPGYPHTQLPETTTYERRRQPHHENHAQYQKDSGGSKKWVRAR